MPRTTPEFSTVGVYRYYNPQTTDHYYTPDKGQGNLAETQGYKIENNGNPEFYIFKRSLGCDTVPFYQWHIGTDHFYTTHPTGELAPFLGGQYQGIIGYVFPASAPVVGSLKQLHRYFKPQ
ncbi:hypothetical protein OPQ81_003279 [Rhizoctonia solani]|nr:hypothetical protein OPQ81_003279 [Rhizoctonia solani]